MSERPSSAAASGDAFCFQHLLLLCSAAPAPPHMIRGIRHVTAAAPAYGAPKRAHLAANHHTTVHRASAGASQLVLPSVPVVLSSPPPSSPRRQGRAIANRSKRQLLRLSPARCWSSPLAPRPPLTRARVPSLSPSIRRTPPRHHLPRPRAPRLLPATWPLRSPPSIRAHPLGACGCECEESRVSSDDREACAVNTMDALLVTLLLLAAAASGPARAAAAPPRAFFVFGDSLVDNGNNNYLMTTARADAPPYGIDFPTHMPTGRFSNGLNIPDIISEHLGSEPALPYLSPDLRGDKLLVGANFASAGVGILNDTGIQFVNIIRIGQQLQNFQEYQQKLAAFVGEDAATQVVNNALVLITLGGNDFVNNYYLVPFSVRSRQFAIQDYVPFLISEYKKILTRLYELGARRVVVTGTGMIGCVPAELAMHSINGECARDLTEAADLFNPQLVHMLNDLNADIGGDVFIVANTNRVSFDFMFNPQDYGFVTAKVACCGQGPYNGIGLCTPASNVCPNRDVYAYWDAFHPTERANRLIVGQFMHGSTDHISPMNISTILAMDNRV